MIEAAVLALALALDLLVGEPPAFLHPVRWMGGAISWLERRAPSGKKAQLLYGAGMAFLVVALFTLPAWLATRLLANFSPLLAILVGAILLKPTFALRELIGSALKVRKSLEAGELEKAREDLQSLVSREREHLSEPMVVSAAAESVAENASDSFVAPLFYFALFGLPGAVAYRAINTLDARIGYHGRYEYLGKAAARLDDLANFIPARLTALLIVMSSVFRGRASPAWRAMLSYHSKTESPNAGWTMSALAGAMGVQLEKEGHYRLGEAHQPLTSSKIQEACQLTAIAAALAALFFILFEIGKDVYFS